MQGAGSSVRRGWFSWDLKDELSLSRGRRVPDRGRRRVRGGPEGKQFRGALNWGQGDLKWGCRGHCGRESLRNWIKKAVIVLRGRWGPEGGTSLSLALGQQREALCQPRPPCGPAHLGLGSAQRWTDGVAPTPRGGSRGAWAHPTCPVNSPEPPLPSGICRGPPPTMGSCSQVPWGCGARTGWRPSGLWLPGLGTLPAPSSFPPSPSRFLRLMADLAG